MAVVTDDLAALFEQVAPNHLAESWDNPGWQVRIPGSEVHGVLVAMEATGEVLNEASHRGCDVVFTHHPTIFRPIKSLDLASSLGAVLGEAVRRGISIWSAHTNLDVMPNGTSFALAQALGLKDSAVLARTQDRTYKIGVYVPPAHAEAVKRAMAEAGAGHIGDYSECFWQVEGTGQFRPQPGADPYLGEVGETERVGELKVETVVHQAKVEQVIEAMRRSHPYEEVAYDLFPLENRVALLGRDYGYGAVGAVNPGLSTAEMARYSASKLESAVCVVAGRAERIHERVAVVGGGGTSFVSDAVRAGATLFLTADVRYHDAQDAVAKGLDLVVLDHYATERPVLEFVQATLSGLLAGVPVELATVASTPYVRIEP